MHAVRSYPTVSKIIDQLKSNSKHYKLYLCVLAIGIIIGWNQTPNIINYIYVG